MIDDGAVLLTGATGFIGSNLATHILATEKRRRMFCLVRPTDDCRPRLVNAMTASARAAGMPESIRPATHRLVAVPGDLSKEGLGLSSRSRQDLENAGITEVWHCASSMRFEDHHRDEIFATNVEGTRRLLTLADRVGAVRFHYMSTAYVAGDRRGAVPETLYDPAEPSNNLYEESKRRAEDLVVAAADRFVVTILRPSIVVGSSKTLDATSQFGLYGFLAGLHRFAEHIEDKVSGFVATHPLRLLCEPGTTLDLMPVDILAQEALEIVRRTDTQQLHFHLTNPFVFDLEQIQRALAKPISRLHGLCFELVSDDRLLRPLDHLFHQRLRFYTPYLMNDKRFERGRDCGRPPSGLRIPEAAITGYAERFLGRLQADTAKRAKKRAMGRCGLQKQTIRGRDGEPLTYYRRGKGPTVVLLNAYGVSLTFWEPVTASLLKSHQVLIWECRGCSPNGASRPYTIREHADDLDQILRCERVDRAHLLAWCTGPKVALEFQHSHPEMVASMTFITGSFAPLPEATDISTRYDEVLGKVARLVCRRPEMAEVFLRALSGMLTEAPPLRGSADEDLRDLMGMVGRRFRELVIGPFLSESVIANYARMIVEFQSHSVAHLLDAAAAPTLLISAENDVIAHPGGSDAAARRMPNARSVRLPCATHWCLLENADELIEEIDRFLSRVDSSRELRPDSSTDGDGWP